VVKLIMKCLTNDKIYPGLPNAFFQKPIGSGDDKSVLRRILEIPGIRESTFTEAELETLE
jgi:hypothetical protein